MSVKSIRETSIATKLLKSAPYRATSDVWVRNPTWLSMPATTSGDEQVDMLAAVYPQAAFATVTATTTLSSQFTVNWGDGTSTNHNSGTTAERAYDFNAVALDNTDGPVTFQNSGNLVLRTAHGYTNGGTISFASIVTTTGLQINRNYFVINATANNFQVSLTQGGAAVALGADGSGTILPFKQAMIKVTTVNPSATISTLNFSTKPTTLGTPLGAITQPYLDITISVNASTINVGNTLIPLRDLQRCRILRHNTTSFDNIATTCSSLRVFESSSTAAVNTFVNAFAQCTSLRTVPALNFSATTTLNSIFNNCSSLQEVTSISAPLCTNTASMFGQCVNLRRIQSLRFGNLTTTSSMFTNCVNLSSIPLFNTATVDSMNSMFSSCRALTSIPLFNTVATLNFSSMFNGCVSLKAMPRLNTTAGLNFSNMFTNCSALSDIVDYNIPNATNTASMFSSCTSLTAAPMLDLNGVLDSNAMFSGCASLTTVPDYDFTTISSLNSMFTNCLSLTTVPNLNVPAATTLAFMFSGCTALANVPDITSSASLTNCQSIFGSCPALATAPNISVTTSITNWQSMFSGCSLLTTVPVYNTNAATSFATMFSSCSNISVIPAFNMGAAVTSSTGYNSLFNSAPNISQIKATGIKFTFTVASLKLSGPALDEIYTNLATVSGQTITVSSNWGTPFDNPSIATGKGWTVTGS